MSAFAKPFLIEPSGTVTVLDRIAFTGDQTGNINEKWLQEVLFASPESLPVREIDPHIGPLIPVCMEIETGSGSADILFVTPTGQVVLVETKLWRNPEARREVVAQVLDYAKQLTTWTYDIMDQKAALAAKTERNHLLRCLRARFPDADETAFVDGVGRSLATGDFLLLIIGDGIRYGAEALVAFLERFGNLRFGLGLIEVAAYRMPDGGTLLQPRVLAKTEILQRTLLIGPNGPVTFEEVAKAEDSAPPNTAQREWFMAFWRGFLDRLDLDDTSVMPTGPAKSPNQFFPMPPNGAMAWISAYIAQSLNKGGVYLTFAKAYARGPAIAEILEADRAAIEREMGVTLSWERTGDKIYIAVPKIAFTDLNVDGDRLRVTQYLADMTGRMVRVLKPRLQAATQSPD
jgi:hypothetical protein